MNTGYFITIINFWFRSCGIFLNFFFLNIWTNFWRGKVSKSKENKKLKVFQNKHWEKGEKVKKEKLERFKTEPTRFENSQDETAHRLSKLNSIRFDSLYHFHFYENSMLHLNTHILIYSHDWLFTVSTWINNVPS